MPMLALGWMLVKAVNLRWQDARVTLIVVLTSDYYAPVPLKSSFSSDTALLYSLLGNSQKQSLISRALLASDAVDCVRLTSMCSVRLEM